MSASQSSQSTRNRHAFSPFLLSGPIYEQPWETQFHGPAQTVHVQPSESPTEWHNRDLGEVERLAPSDEDSGSGAFSLGLVPSMRAPSSRAHADRDLKSAIMPQSHEDLRSPGLPVRRFALNFVSNQLVNYSHYD